MVSVVATGIGIAGVAVDEILKLVVEETGGQVVLEELKVIVDESDSSLADEEAGELLLGEDCGAPTELWGHTKGAKLLSTSWPFIATTTSEPLACRA
jgi:hypothetical protein